MSRNAKSRGRVACVADTRRARASVREAGPGDPLLNRGRSSSSLRDSARIRGIQILIGGGHLARCWFWLIEVPLHPARACVQHRRYGLHRRPRARVAAPVAAVKPPRRTASKAIAAPRRSDKIALASSVAASSSALLYSAPAFAAEVTQLADGSLDDAIPTIAVVASSAPSSTPPRAPSRASPRSSSAVRRRPPRTSSSRTRAPPSLSSSASATALRTTSRIASRARRASTVSAPPSPRAAPSARSSPGRW